LQPVDGAWRGYGEDEREGGDAERGLLRWVCRQAGRQSGLVEVGRVDLER
jgi:hypothetical protein